MLAGAKSSQSLCLGISNKETINIHGVIQLWAALAKIHTTSLHFKHISSSDLLELETVSIIRNIIMSTTRACSIMYIERERVSPTCLVVEQLYLDDLEVKVIPVDRSPPSLSSS